MMLAIIIVLLVIMVSITFVKYLSQAAAGSLPLSSAFSLVGIILPRFLSMLIPISFFLSIVLVYGKLFADSELLVMFACGLSWWRLTLYTLIPSAVLAILVGFLSVYVVPLMSHYQDNLQALSSVKANALSLAATGRFLSLDQGKKVVYIGSSASGSNAGRNIFIYQKQAANKSRVILSPKGFMQAGNNGKAQYLVLQDGHVYQGVIGQQNFQLIKFKQYTAMLTHPVYNIEHPDLSSLSTLALMHNPNVSQWTELQWRFALPLTMLIVTFMGVAICYVGPRRGRYRKLVNAILLFIIYFNSLTIIKSWMSDGSWPVWLGLWSIELAFFVYGAITISKLDGLIHFKWLRRSDVEA